MADEIGPVSTKFMAECLGVSERRVQQLASEGVIPFTSKGRAKRYDVREAVRAYVEYLKELDGERAAGDEDINADKLAAERDLKRARAREAELQLAELERTMHRAEDVEEVIADIVARCRSLMTALPGRVAKDAAEASTPAEATQVVRAAVHEALAQMAGYRYDPEEFAERTRERRGWRDGDADEEAAD